MYLYPWKISLADNAGKTPLLPPSKRPLGKVVDYGQTTRYHWSQFDLNNTNPEAVGASKVVLGPFQFKNAIQLDKDKGKV